MTPPSPPAPTRALVLRLLAGLGAVLVVLLLLASSNVGAIHAPTPHNVPVGLSAPAPVAAQVEHAVAAHQAGAIAFHLYPSEAAARRGVLTREVYGAYVPLAGRLYVASAASATASAFLTAAFGAIAAHSPGHAGGGAGALVTRDLVPLPASDSRGGTTFAVLIALIITAILGSVVLFLLGAHLSLGARILAALGFAVAAGLVGTLVTNVVVNAFPGRFLAVWGVDALFVAALVLPVAALQALAGIAATAVGVLAFLVVGSPASGGVSAPEFLPGFWRFVSQALPPGAANAALRDTEYFSGHGAGSGLWLLTGYAVVGAALLVLVSVLRARRNASPTPATTATPATGAQATAPTPAETAGAPATLN